MTNVCAAKILLEKEKSNLNRWHFIFFFLLMFDLFVRFYFVMTKTFARRKSLVTEVTWNTYSFKMITLNVISYQRPLSLFSAYFANVRWFLLGRSICLFTLRNHIFDFLHHWLNLFTKRLEVRAWLILNCFCSRGCAWNICLILDWGCCSFWANS